jgi:demethylmenaquinone methyltransferase/2-methoxy-6-polyprenyl-1,4-benzoquinol methylase
MVVAIGIHLFVNVLAARRNDLFQWKARDGRNPRELAEMGTALHLEDGAFKERYVSTLFDILAPGYDSFTRLFSFGMDRFWKARLIQEGTRRLGKLPCILDIACGTGDLASSLDDCTESPFILGLDASLEMLREATRRLRNREEHMRFAACDMQQLCVRDHCADMVSMGYGLRNTVDLDQALREIARVLKPGGVFINLDFYRPAQRAWRELFLWYMWHAGRFAGWLWHREPMVYGYLAPSIRAYATIPEFESALRSAGFQIEWSGSRLGGAVGLHVARRMANA